MATAVGGSCLLDHLVYLASESWECAQRNSRQPQCIYSSEKKQKTVKRVNTWYTGKSHALPSFGDPAQFLASDSCSWLALLPMKAIHPSGLTHYTHEMLFCISHNEWLFLSAQPNLAVNAIAVVTLLENLLAHSYPSDHPIIIVRSSSLTWWRWILQEAGYPWTGLVTTALVFLKRLNQCKHQKQRQNIVNVMEITFLPFLMLTECEQYLYKCVCYAVATKLGKYIKTK